MAKNIVIKVMAKGAKPTVNALKNVGSAVTSIGVKAGIATAGFAAFSAKLAGDFQKNLLEISTLMDEGSFSIERMGAELQKVSGASGLALESLSKARYDIVSAGFSSASESAQLLNTSMQLAVGGVTSAAEAADLLTSSLNAFGLESEDSQKVSDSLFQTVKLGKTTIGELAQSLGQVLPFADAMNLSLDGVGAAMATLTAAGINTAEATTALKGTITAIESPGKAAKKAMEEAGVEVKRFGDGSVDLFSTMKQFAGIDPATLSKFVPDKRAQLGIKAMSGNLKTLKFNIDEFAEAATNGESETTTAFDKMQTAFNTQMARMKNNAHNGMIVVGNAIIEVIQPKIEAVNELFNKIGDIGWNVIGERLKNESDTIMEVMKLSFQLGLDVIKANVRLTALQLAESLNKAIMPKFLQTDFTERISEATKNAENVTKNSTDQIKAMYADLFAKLSEGKGEETTEFIANEGKKAPAINKITGALEEEGDQITANANKESVRYENSISGIKSLIKGYYSQMIAKAIVGEADKGLAGLITGSIAATAFATLFDEVVPKFAQGGIVPGTGNQDTVPAMLTPGELILNQAQQDNLAGGMNNITINVTAPLVDETIIDTIIPAINNAVNNNTARLNATTAKAASPVFGVMY